MAFIWTAFSKHIIKEENTLQIIKYNDNKRNAVSINILKSIDTSYSSHSRLSKLAIYMSKLNAREIIIDFQRVQFIASNQFAVLGCILSSYITNHPQSNIYFQHLNAKITETIRKNGFYKHLGLEKLADTYNTVIPYTIFNMDEINEFEKYILLKIFNRSDIPQMSERAKSNIMDNILEIFNNVKEHTHSSKIFTCGQYFPSSSLLYLTIVDSGETIQYNVNKYFKNINAIPPDNTLEWAMVAGNTTRSAKTPGGLGLSLLKDFVELNMGHLYIVSGNETYEKKGEKERYKYMEPSFTGTIVTVAFNLSDTHTYSMVSEIQF